MRQVKREREVVSFTKDFNSWILKNLRYYFRIPLLQKNTQAVYHKMIRLFASFL